MIYVHITLSLDSTYTYPISHVTHHITQPSRPPPQTNSIHHNINTFSSQSPPPPAPCLLNLALDPSLNSSNEVSISCILEAKCHHAHRPQRLLRLQSPIPRQRTSRSQIQRRDNLIGLLSLWHSRRRTHDSHLRYANGQIGWDR